MNGFDGHLATTRPLAQAGGGVLAELGEHYGLDGQQPCGVARAQAGAQPVPYLAEGEVQRAVQRAYRLRSVYIGALIRKAVLAMAGTVCRLTGKRPHLESNAALTPGS